MELNRLKQMRIIVPGIVVLLFLIPIYVYLYGSGKLFDKDNVNIGTGVMSLLICYLIGYVYNSYQLRGWRNKKTLKEINLNIKQQLFEIGRTLPTSDDDKNRIIDGKELMSIFYNIVDNDHSLTEKAKIVRSNGLFWTSTADVAVISMIFTYIYLVLFLVSKGLYYAYAGLIIGSIGLFFGCILHPTSVKRHISLSNDQIGYMKDIYLETLRQKINFLS